MNEQGLLDRWVDAGWDRAGERDISDAANHLTARGFLVHDGVRAVLGELHAAKVVMPPVPPKRKPHVISFDAMAASAVVEAPSLEHLSAEHEIDLGLVGFVPSSRALWLGADQNGWLYAGLDARRLHLLGHTIPDALVVLSGPPETWPPAPEPARESHPVVHVPGQPAPVSTPEQAAALVGALTEIYPQGPVLAVTDLGSVWRVFRAFRRDWPTPHSIPYLVRKDTGTVLVEWPLLDARPTAQEARRDLERQLSALLARNPGVVMRDRGWARAGRPDEPVVRLRVASSSANRAVVPLHLQVDAGDVNWYVDHADTDGGPEHFVALAGVDPTSMAETLYRAVVAELGLPT